METKQKLHKLIDDADDRFIEVFYEMAKAYKKKVLEEQLIAEGEKDIKKGNTHSLKETKEIVKSWGR